MASNTNTTDAVRLWLSKDHAGVNLWRHRPKFCFANELYFNGGETLTLAEGAFSSLHVGACIEVEVRRVTGD